MDSFNKWIQLTKWINRILLKGEYDKSKILTRDLKYNDKNTYLNTLNYFNFEKYKNCSGNLLFEIYSLLNIFFNFMILVKFCLSKIFKPHS